jgi:hypothetical protein
MQAVIDGHSVSALMRVRFILQCVEESMGGGAAEGAGDGSAPGAAGAESAQGQPGAARPATLARTLSPSGRLSTMPMRRVPSGASVLQGGTAAPSVAAALRSLPSLKRGQTMQSLRGAAAAASYSNPMLIAGAGAGAAAAAGLSSEVELASLNRGGTRGQAGGASPDGGTAAGAAGEAARAEAFRSVMTAGAVAGSEAGEAPAAGGAAAGHAAEAPAARPRTGTLLPDNPEWRVYSDANSGQEYFYCASTGETSWTRPPAAS